MNILLLYNTAKYKSGIEILKKANRDMEGSTNNQSTNNSATACKSRSDGWLALLNYDLRYGPLKSKALVGQLSREIMESVC